MKRKFKPKSITLLLIEMDDYYNRGLNRAYNHYIWLLINGRSYKYTTMVKGDFWKNFTPKQKRRLYLTARKHHKL